MKKYPDYNDTKADTGLRMLNIVVACTEKDREALGGEYGVFYSTLTRRLDAVTTEGDIWSTDLSDVLFAGTKDACLQYIASYAIQDDCRYLFSGPGKLIWLDIKADRAYIDTLSGLCDCGDILADNLNYAAALKNAFCPFDPSYDPEKRARI